MFAHGHDGAYQWGEFIGDSNGQVVLDDESGHHALCSDDTMTVITAGIIPLNKVLQHVRGAGILQIFFVLARRYMRLNAITTAVFYGYVCTAHATQGIVLSFSGFNNARPNLNGYAHKKSDCCVPPLLMQSRSSVDPVDLIGRGLHFPLDSANQRSRHIYSFHFRRKAAAQTSASLVVRRYAGLVARC